MGKYRKDRLEAWYTSTSRLGVKYVERVPVSTEDRARQLGELLVCRQGHVHAAMRSGGACLEPECGETFTRKLCKYPGVVAALLLAETLVPDGAQAWTYDELWQMLDAAEPWP